MPVTSGLPTWGGDDSETYLSADGAVFHCFYAKSGALSVWRIAPDGTRAPVELPLLSGQGSITLQGNGELWFSGYAAAGDRQPIVYGPVPGFVPFAQTAAAALPKLAMPPEIAAIWRGRDYVAEDFDTDAEDALRVDKQRKAIIAFADLLVALGLVEA